MEDDLFFSCFFPRCRRVRRRKRRGGEKRNSGRLERPAAMEPAALCGVGCSLLLSPPPPPSPSFSNARSNSSNSSNSSRVLLLLLLLQHRLFRLWMAERSSLRCCVLRQNKSLLLLLPWFWFYGPLFSFSSSSKVWCCSLA